MSTTTDEETIKKLIDGELPWSELRNEVLPDPKDPNRFEVTREILQERVDWENPILVPINDHVFVVGSDEGRIFKAACGQEFCSVEENWKHHTRVRVREGKDELADLYTEWQAPSTEWQFQLREFLCPNCLALLDVEAVPVGYPVQQKFEPDIDVFYEEWRDEPAPDKQ